MILVTFLSNLMLFYTELFTSCSYVLEKVINRVCILIQFHSD